MEFIKLQHTHFFILSIIPLFLIYSFNVEEIPILDLRFPILISVSVIGIVYLFLRIKFDSAKVSVILSTFLIMFIIHGNIRYYLKNQVILSDSVFSSSIFLGIIFLSIPLMLIFFIFKKNIISELNKILMIFSLTLFLVLMPTAIIYFINDSPSLDFSQINLDIELSEKPNLYVILLDEFAGQIQLNQDFNYYPHYLMSNLDKRNFQTPINSFSNYPNTAYSLPSVLNMEYLEYVTNELGPDSKNTIKALDLRNNNNLMKIFKNNGYHITSFYGGMGASGAGNLVDEKVCAPFNINNDLKEKFFLIYFPFSYFNNELINNPLNEKISCIREYINNLETSKEPKFLFIHLRLPHHPYVYNSSGDFISDSNLDNKDKNGYLEQLKFSEKLAVDIIDTIQQKDPNSFIVIFSDHGYRSHINWNDRNNFENVIRGHNVIISFYTNEHQINLPKNVTLVNIFRIIINQISDEKLEILENKLYWYGLDEPNRHYDVSEIIFNNLQ